MQINIWNQQTESHPSFNNNTTFKFTKKDVTKKKHFTIFINVAYYITMSPHCICTVVEYQ